MGMTNSYRQRTFPLLVWTVFFCVLTFSLGGCSTLRRKFVRKKKEDKAVSQKFVPVLEPIDYPDNVYSPLDKYQKYYSLWRVWERDLLQAVKAKESDKRQKYLLVQTIEQLEGMAGLLTEAKKVEFLPVVEDLREVGDVYDKPAFMRNTFSIQKKIERNSRKVRNDFAPDPALLGLEE